MLRSFLLVLSLLLLAAAARAQSRDIGTVDIAADRRTTTVAITGSPELVALAQTAFRVHGRYRVTADRAAYTLAFEAAGANQVRLTVSSGNPARVVHTEVVSGLTPRNALFRAADAAVRQTSGLPGFFASRLAFVSERTGKREIYVSDLFFGEVFQITNDRSDALSPRWSPDGSRIIYTSYFASGFPDIYVIDVNSRQRTVFASFKGTNSGARFSPDGRSVALIASGSGNPEVYIGPATGGRLRQLTKNTSVEASPAWSPDGSRLVLTSDRDGGPQLYTMAAAGGAMSRVPTNISGYCAEPDWSAADPNKLAFTIRMGRGFAIAVYDFAAGKSTPLSTGGGDAVEPCWLADGRHLIFTARGPNTRRTMIVDTETGKVTALSPAVLGQVSQAHALPPR